MDYTKTPAYRLGKTYQEFGELLMNPRTDLRDLAAAAAFFGCTLTIALVPADSAAPTSDPTRDGEAP